MIPTLEILQAELAKQKVAAKAALESLIGQCYDEIRNIERFDDFRLLIATADIESSVQCVMDAADALEEAYNDTKPDCYECGERATRQMQVRESCPTDRGDMEWDSWNWFCDDCAWEFCMFLVN